MNEDDRSISVLILSYTDVKKIFSFHSNNWLSCPVQWYNRTTSLKLGGLLQEKKLRFIALMQKIRVHLPYVLGFIRGTIDADRFVMIGYQLG